MKTLAFPLYFVIYDIFFNNYLCSEMFHCCNRVAAAKTLSWKLGFKSGNIESKMSGDFQSALIKSFSLLPRFTIKPKH